MCGISGFSLNPNDTDINNARHLAGTLLLGIEHRGKDATGACWHDPQGSRQIQKAPVTASAFVRNLAMWKKTSDAILHTRAWTQGSPDNPANNHPIVAGNITGVHNGMCYNDDDLFKILNVERNALVDSEAIFATIAYGTDRLGDERSKVSECLELVEGSAALAWYDDNDTERTLYLARVSSSPLVIASTTGGSLVFASTENAIREAVTVATNATIEDIHHAPEGTMFAIRDGAIIERSEFEPAWSGYRKPMYTGNSRYTVVTTTSPAKVIEPAAEPVVDKAESDVFIDSVFFDFNEPIGYARETLDRYYGERFAAIDHHDRLYDGARSNKLGAMLYPGDLVYTEIGSNVCTAQIVEIPNSFPRGFYILRAALGKDTVMVRKTIDEFDWSEPHNAGLLDPEFAADIDGDEFTALDNALGYGRMEGDAYSNF